MSRYEPDTVADVLHENLRARIWVGDFLPGDRVSIRALAQAEGLSVIPVRDAVRRLIAEGGLAFVDSRTIEVPRLTAENHSEVLFARVQVETELVARAYPNLTNDDLNTLLRLDDQVNEAIGKGDLGRYMKANFDFHFHIYRKAKAPVLMRLVEILWLQSGPSMRYVAGQYGAQSTVSDHHKEMTDQLQQRNVAGFIQALREDVIQGMDFILAATRHELVR